MTQNEAVVQKAPSSLWRVAVAEAVKQFQHGDLILDPWLFQQFDLEPPTATTLARDADRTRLRFLGMFEQFAWTLLTKHRMAVERVRGKGYRIMKPEEQTDSFMGAFVDDLDRAFRLTAAGLKYVDRTQLTTEQCRRNDDAQARVSSIEMFTGKRLAAPVSKVTLKG